MLEERRDILFLDGKFRIGRIDRKTNSLFMFKKKTDFYRALDSISINLEVINYGFDKFVLDTDNGERYVITLKKIKALHKLVNLFIVNKRNNNERQFTVPVKCWDRYATIEATLPVHIGISPDEFLDNIEYRWSSRPKHNEDSQIELNI